MDDLVQRLRASVSPWSLRRDLEVALQAADRIEQLESEIQEQCRINGMGAEREAALLAKVERLETALAGCRDSMPKPAPGERPEQSWSEALGDPLAVPAYVKETVARLERENAEIRKDTERYYWLVANRKYWSWQPSAYNKDSTSGFAAYNTGYLGFDFEPAIDEAMK